MKGLPLAPAVAVALLAAAAAHAAPPANDREAGAAPLELNQPLNGSWAEAVNDYTLSGSTCFTGIGQTPSTAGGPDLVYRFVAPSAGSYVFRVRKPSAFDVLMYTAPFLPSGGGPQVVTGCDVAANRNSVQAAEETAPVALAGGQALFVVLDSETTAASAELAFQLVAERVSSEIEPNGTPATANTASCGVRGVTSPTDDVDFWSLGQHAVGSRLFALVDGAAGAGSNWDLRVTTPTDTLEFDDGAADFPFGNNSPAVGGTPLPAGPAYMRVSLNGTVNEPYRLYSVLQPPSPAGADSEPNDTIAGASSTDGWSSGELSSADDADIYRFDAPARGRVFIAVDADPGRNNTPFDPVLQLLDSSGATMLAVNDVDAASTTTSGAGSLTSTTPSSPAEAIVARVPTAGSYYVRVSKSTAGSSDYSLSVSSSCRPGRPVSAIVVSPGSLPNARQGRRYIQSITATGGFGAHAFSVAAGALPRGLALGSSGVLAGRPRRAGIFTFTVRATDADESVGERAYSLVVVDRTRPVVSRFRVTKRVFTAGRGTRLRFRLSEPARVAIAIQRRTTGKRSGGRCLKRTRRLRNRRDCTRFANTGRMIRFAGKAGANSRVFRGRALGPRRYRARLIATDAARNRSRPKTAAFRVRRR